MKLTDIIDWRSNERVRPRDIYAFDFDITYEEVLNLVEDINNFYKFNGSDLRVRKSWKAVEACEEGEEIE